MPGVKPVRSDLPAGEYYDKEFEKRLNDWRQGYIDAGMDVPGEPKKPIGGAKPAPPSPGPSPAPAGGKSAAEAGAGAAGGTQHATEVFINEKGQIEARGTGYNAAAADAAMAQDKAQKGIAAKAGSVATGGAVAGKPQYADFNGDMGAYQAALKEWTAAQKAGAGTTPSTKTPLYPR